MSRVLESWRRRALCRAAIGNTHDMCRSAAPSRPRTDLQPRQVPLADPLENPQTGLRTAHLRGADPSVRTRLETHCQIRRLPLAMLPETDRTEPSRDSPVRAGSGL